MYSISFRQRTAYIWAASVIVLLSLSNGVYAQTEKQGRKQAVTESQPANIDRNGILILVRNTIIAVDQANKTGNYTVFRDLSAPGFRINDAAKLGEIFARQRTEGVDLAGVAVLEPQLTSAPQLEPGNLLRLTGFFPSVPTQVNFDLVYAPDNNQWKIFSIYLNLTKGGLPAPDNVQPEQTKKEVPKAPPAPSTKVQGK